MTEPAPASDDARPIDRRTILAIAVAALGYFVDLFDLVLFSILRVPSLKALGVTDPAEITRIGKNLLDIQLIGMLLGGIAFGMLGDRFGRLKTLFGSILLYSVANILNAFVTDVWQYEVLRFVAGFGLAGELGAGITLVSELLPAAKRGIGTSLVAGIGLLGAVAAFFVAQAVEWRTAYFIGGGMGLSLLLLRLKVLDSGLFHQTAARTDVVRGSLFQLFRTRERSMRYLRSVLIGLPTWYMIGILVQRASTVFAPAAGITGEPVKTNWAVAAFYLGLTFGDLASGIASQLLKSRKKVVAAFLGLSLLCVGVYLYGADGWTTTGYYRLIFLMGFGMGYWALFVTIAAEQFGTNLRATVATTVPNFARGSLVLLTFCFTMLIGTKEVPNYAPSTAGLILGVVCFGAAFLALWKMEETYGKDLDYQEQK